MHNRRNAVWWKHLNPLLHSAISDFTKALAEVVAKRGYGEPFKYEKSSELRVKFFATMSMKH